MADEPKDEGGCRRAATCCPLPSLWNRWEGFCFRFFIPATMRLAAYGARSSTATGLDTSAFSFDPTPRAREDARSYCKVCAQHSVRWVMIWRACVLRRTGLHEPVPGLRTEAAPTAAHAAALAACFHDASCTLALSTHAAKKSKILLHQIHPPACGHVALEPTLKHDTSLGS